MGHIGLTPQSATKLGGFKAQGRTADAAMQLYEDALALQEAGCFAIVLEAVPAPVAARDHARRSRSRRSASAPAPAATARCSSGTTCSACTPGRTPRFVKRYAELADEIGDARRALRRRGAQRRVPRGAAHLRDPRRGARALRGGAHERALSATHEQRRHDADRERARGRSGARARSSRAPRGPRSRAAPPPRGRTRARARRRRVAPAPESLPPLRKTSLAVERELHRPERRATARPARRRTRARAATRR